MIGSVRDRNFGTERKRGEQRCDLSLVAEIQTVAPQLVGIEVQDE